MRLPLLAATLVAASFLRAFAQPEVVEASQLSVQSLFSAPIESESDTIKASYDVTSCPGYRVAGPKIEARCGFTVPLTLAGPACNAFGVDIQNLTLAVIYEAPERLHVHVFDTAHTQYQQPLDLIFSRASSSPDEVDGVTAEESHLQFHMSDEREVFEWWITRKDASDDAEPLFDTRASKMPLYEQGLGKYEDTERNSTTIRSNAMVFENQYLQLSSALPRDASLYGLGERISGGGIGDASWRLPEEMLQPFFTLDDENPVESNMYGYHPIYLESRQLADGTLSSHVVALQSTSGLDVIRRPGLIQYRAIGGTLDFRFFSGSRAPNSGDVSSAVEQHPSAAVPAVSSLHNSPTTALAQYNRYLGPSAMIPRWSLGLHLLRWGYHTLAESRASTQRMRDADIPLETVWADIDWLHDYRNFIPDEGRWPAREMKEYVEELKSRHQGFIPIVDAGFPAAPVNATDVYAPGSRGQELNVFLKNANGTLYTGKVWPGLTYFADNLSPSLPTWWRESLANMSSLFDFRGIWSDMQEPASFCIGNCVGREGRLDDTPLYTAATQVGGWPEGYDNETWGNSGNATIGGQATYRKGFTSSAAMPAKPASPPMTEEQKQEERENLDNHYRPASHEYSGVEQRFLWDPPYAIHNGDPTRGPLVDNLNKKTVAMDTRTHDGVFYDTHNLDGTLSSMHIARALQELKPHERPFVLSRSTAPGAGRWAHHWLGDNYSTWQFLAKSIQGILQFQLFGIHMVGADACGFNRNSAEELCNRWMMLAAFTPFVRNHNRIGAIPQEPYVWDSVAEASRKALYKRMELLPAIYTTMQRASQRGIAAVRSLWFDFPASFDTLRGTDTQFLFGDLLVSPVLEPNTSSVQAFFPSAGGAWVNVFDYSRVSVYDRNITLPAPLSSINVHLRPSRVLLTHAAPRYTTHESAQGPFGLLVNLDDEGEAEGEAYVDDGISPLPTPSAELRFIARNGVLRGTAEGDYAVEQRLERITLLGIERMPRSVAVNGREVEARFDEETLRLEIEGAGIDLNSAWEISWS